jgi:hypothetical protein
MGTAIDVIIVEGVDENGGLDADSEETNEAVP